MADDTPVLSPGAAALLKRSKAVITPDESTTNQTATQSSGDAQLSPGAAALLKKSKITPNADMSQETAPSDSLPTQFGQGLTEGVAGLAGLPGAIGKGINWLAGGSPKPEDNQSFWSPHGRYQLPTPADILGKVPWYNPTQPNSLTGELVRGAGAATPTLALGALTGLPAAANAAYTYIPSLAGDLLHHYYGINPAWAAIPTALTMSGLERTGSEMIEKYTATQAAKQAAAEEAKFKQATPGFGQTQREQMAGTRAEIERKRVATEADAMKYHDSEHVGADADREAVASSLGTSPTIQDAGEALQNAARNWKKTEFPQKLKDAENKMYYNPDGSVAIPEDALGNLSNFNSSLKNSFYKAGELEPAAEKLRSRMPERLQDALDEIAKNQGLPPGSVPKATFSDMKKLRSILGDAMTSPKLTEGVDAGKMNELYRALSGDMEGAINNAAGPAGVARFKQFNEEAKRLYGLASGPVSDVISTVDKAGETITPTEAVSKLGLGDGTKLAQFGSEDTLKKGLNEVAAAKLRAGKGPGTDPGEPDKFFSNLTPQAKSALFGDENAGKIQDSIDRRTQADKDLEDMRTASKKIAATSVKGAQLAKGQEKAQRAEEGVKLSQAAADTAAKERALKYPPTAGGEHIPPWVKQVGGFLTGAYSGHKLLPGADTPWDNALALGLGLTGALAVKGGQEMVRNPASLRNMAVSGTAVTPFNRGPGGTP